MKFFSWLRHLLGWSRSAPAADAADDDSFDPDEPFPDGTDFPVRDSLDLHGLPPKIVPELVREYLAEARRRGFRRVRIVHGKGIGVQRGVVRSILAKTEFVEAFDDAPQDSGSWGATIAHLRPGAN